MKTKLFSLLAMLFVSISLSLGFTSCSSDDDDDDPTALSDGTAAGETFIKHIEAYQAIEGEDLTATAKKLEAGAEIYKDYQKYKQNKEWKEAFLKGAAKEDVKKYETLNEFLEKDYSSLTAIAGALGDLLNILGQK